MRALASLLEREKRWAPFGVSLDPVRALPLPDVPVIGVGGATLGGSGRTPLAIAIARSLSERGLSTALVSHGYGGREAGVRRVRDGDDARDVGDEAWIAARSFEGPVFVGPRHEALVAAAREAQVVVVDRLLQTRPERLACSILAVDVHAPWGAGVRLPFGNLLARPEELVASADEVVAVGGALAPVTLTTSRALAGLRLGAIATLARPARMRSALESLGVHPLTFVERADHRPFDARELARLDVLGKRCGVDAWVVDAKTHAHLPGELRATAIVLSQSVEPSPELMRRILSHAKLANASTRC